MKTLLCALALAAFSTAAQADVATLVFDHPDQFGEVGDTLHFFGTITNNTADVLFLNSDTLTLTDPDITVTDLFHPNVPASLAPGANSGDIDLFDVTLTGTWSSLGETYPGVYTLLGGPNGSASEMLTSADVSVTVAPEPGSLYLLLSVSAALLAIAKKTRARV